MKRTGQISRAYFDDRFGPGEHLADRLPLCWTCREEPVKSVQTFKAARADGRGFLEWRRPTAVTCARKTCVDVHAWAFPDKGAPRLYVKGIEPRFYNAENMNLYWLARYLKWLTTLNRHEQRRV